MKKMKKKYQFKITFKKESKKYLIYDSILLNVKRAKELLITSDFFEIRESQLVKIKR